MILQRCACYSSVTVWFTLNRLWFWPGTSIGQQTIIHTVKKTIVTCSALTSVPPFVRVAAGTTIDKAYPAHVPAGSELVISACTQSVE